MTKLIIRVIHHLHICNMSLTCIHINSLTLDTQGTLWMLTRQLFKYRVYKYLEYTCMIRMYSIVWTEISLTLSHILTREKALKGDDNFIFLTLDRSCCTEKAEQITGCNWYVSIYWWKRKINVKSWDRSLAVFTCTVSLKCAFQGSIYSKIHCINSITLVKRVYGAWEHVYLPLLSFSIHIEQRHVNITVLFNILF